MAQATTRTTYHIDGQELEVDGAAGTRDRVRAVAGFMFRELGYPIDQITQTLVYRTLRQGSLTTISEELRRWKEDVSGQLRDSDLPAPLLAASVALWRAAREEADRELEAKRLEYAKQVDQMKDVVNEARTAEAAERAEAERMRQQLEELKTALAALRADLNTAHDTLKQERERASDERKELVSRIVALEGSLADEQDETKRLRDELVRSGESYQIQIKSIQDWANEETGKAMMRFDAERTKREELGKAFDRFKEERAALLSEEKAKSRDLAAQIAVLDVRLESMASSNQRLADQIAQNDEVVAQANERLRQLEANLGAKDAEIRELVTALAKQTETGRTEAPKKGKRGAVRPKSK